MTNLAKSRLGYRLRDLFQRAKAAGEPQQIVLQSGLHVRVHEEWPKFFVWRTEGPWEPGDAAEREGRVCAESLGWRNFSLRWHGRFLVVEDTGGLL